MINWSLVSRPVDEIDHFWDGGVIYSHIDTDFFILPDADQHSELHGWTDNSNSNSYFFRKKSQKILRKFISALTS